MPDSERSYKDFSKMAVESGDNIEGQPWFIVPGPVDGLNGYAVFDKRPTIETGYNGLVGYVPVHGGITFMRECAELEPQYLLARTNDEKALICQQISDLQSEEWRNFAVMLNLLSGEL